MNKKQVILLLAPFMMIGCNNSNVNRTKSPFNDSYNPIGMKGEYNITNIMSIDDFNAIKTQINNDYKDNNTDIVKSYTRVEESRDLKAAYFGKNLGAANLCALTHQSSTNTRYSNFVTTQFSTSHKENQTVSGGINKTNSTINDYLFQDGELTSTSYQGNRQTKNDSEEEKVEKFKEGTFVITDPLPVFGLNPYKDDIKNYFGDITRREQHITFDVLGTNNNAIYGMSGDKYLIKEATSLFVPYSTTVGDTYKAVDNFFYEALLEKDSKGKFRFTNFRYYTELLILSEAISDEKTVPVLYLEKPQLVEYTETKYTINYVKKAEFTDTFDKTKIPQVTQ